MKNNTKDSGVLRNPEKEKKFGTYDKVDGM
jgi:hypothetical protein